MFSLIDYVGGIIAKHERDERYGNGIGPYCTGGEDSDSEDGFDTPLVDCAYTRGSLRLLTTILNLKLMLGMCLKIFIQERKFCVIMVTNINFMGI